MLLAIEGKLEIKQTIAVRATVKAPCHGTLPLTLLADFLAAARYIKVGIVVATMIMFGEKVNRW